MTTGQRTLLPEIQESAAGVCRHEEEAGVEKSRHWQNMIREAARSELSVWEFCRRRQLTISQSYWWQRRLKPQQTAARIRPDLRWLSENGESAAAWIPRQRSLGGSPFDSVEPVSHRSRPK